MSNLRLLSKILCLRGRKVARSWFSNRGKELHLAVKPYKSACRWPRCERGGRIVRPTTALRRWEDLTLMGMKTPLCPDLPQWPQRRRIESGDLLVGERIVEGPLSCDI